MHALHAACSPHSRGSSVENNLSSPPFYPILYEASNHGLLHGLTVEPSGGESFPVRPVLDRFYLRHLHPVAVLTEPAPFFGEPRAAKRLGRCPPARLHLRLGAAALLALPGDVQSITTTGHGQVWAPFHPCLLGRARASHQPGSVGRAGGYVPRLAHFLARWSPK